jgi:DNA-directed RNA polymerase specialized sigma24 family protein
MNALTILSKHHKEWLNIVRLFGENEFAEDVVQDVYLKIDQYNYYERIIQD